jgi:hypothetical protein
MLRLDHDENRRYPHNTLQLIELREKAIHYLPIDPCLRTKTERERERERQGILQDQLKQSALVKFIAICLCEQEQYHEIELFIVIKELFAYVSHQHDATNMHSEHQSKSDHVR